MTAVKLRRNARGEQEVVPLGKIEVEGTTSSKNKIHYQYEWIVTVEIPAMTERESKEKLNKFKSELYNRYAVTDDVWLTGIRRWNGNK
jgi:ribosome maturation protein Sdo1